MYSQLKLRHFLIIIQTPDGVVKRQHWIAVWNEEEKLIKKHLPRYVPGLLKTTVFPSGFGRMKVAPANKVLRNFT